MKKSILIVLGILTLSLTSCGSDSPDPIVVLPTCNDGIQNGDETGIDCGGSCGPCTGVENVSGLITSNTTWTSDNVYILNGKVVVDNGVTLTIEPGTIIKGKEGQGSLASALIIARGAKIDAQGTAEKPIIMTSIKDNIEIGQTAGTNLTIDDNGLWGGLMVLGKAKGSFKGDVTEVQIEGIPASDSFGLYGGNDDDDNSGIMKYISIRHGGTDIGEGNEINGLTLGAVGSGTLIENIEVVANFDDGIEFFGGTVNAKNLIVYAVGDDGLDIDQAYAGTISNSFVIIGAISDHGLEIDGPEGAYEAGFTLNNITLQGNTITPEGEYADYRDRAMGASNNVYAYGFKDVSDVELDNDGVATNFNNGKLTFGTWEIVLPTGVSDVKTIFANKAENVSVSGFGDSAVAVTAGSQTVGADLSVFDWTYANSVNGY
ncbi:hypothetical protein [Namhaeicola litoreus]|uniref:Uncharacterized protein n=1 Tax=Namhaeicola litoreus TaxID=1052145 RepID=A0ABW3XZC2_9FLAO